MSFLHKSFLPMWAKFIQYFIKCVSEDQGLGASHVCEIRLRMSNVILIV